MSGPYQTPVAALISIRPASVSMSPVSPLAPSDRPPRALVIPDPLIVPPVQVVMPPTIRGAEPPRLPLDSFSVAVLALASNTTVAPF